MSNKLKLLDEKEHQENKEWYSDGLYFKCTGCGKCCTGSPGYVWLTHADIEKLVTYLKISEEEFIKKYTRKIGEKYSLKEDPKTFDCIFLKDSKICTAYEHRPSQCKTYPYWLENIKSKKDWETEAKRCEGINHKDAELVPIEEIQKQILAYLETRLYFF